MANVYDQAREYVNQKFQNASPKSGKTALILCLLFGGFGAHRFYVGKFLSGVLYMFTGGGFIIGSLIDFVCIMIGKFKDKDGRVVYLDAQAAYNEMQSNIDYKQLKDAENELTVLKAKIVSLQNSRATTEQKINVLREFAANAKYQETVDAANETIRYLMQEGQ